MCPGKFAPGLVLLYLGIGQAVVVGGNIGFERRSLLLPFLLQEKFIQNGRLGIGLPPTCFLVKVCQTLGRESEGSPQFAISIGYRHLT